MTQVDPDSNSRAWRIRSPVAQNSPGNRTSHENSRSELWRSSLGTGQVVNNARPPATAQEVSLRKPTKTLTFDSVQIAYMTSGTGRLTAPRQESAVGIGDIIALPPGLPRRAIPFSGMRFVSLHLHPRYVEEQMEWLAPRNPITRLLSSVLSDATQFQVLRFSPTSARMLASPLKALVQNGSPNYASWFSIMANVAILFDYTARLEARTHTGMHRRQTHLYAREEVVQAIEIMNDNLRHPWRIGDLAAMVRLSPSQLTRLFRRYVNCSPLAFLNQLRADQMAENLLADDMNVTEAAKQVGWNNLPTASRTFKQRHGMSPAQYRALGRTRS